MNAISRENGAVAFSAEQLRELLRLKADRAADELRHLRQLIGVVEANGAWRALVDSDGRPWPSLAAFLQAPREGGGVGLEFVGAITPPSPKADA